MKKRSVSKVKSNKAAKQNTKNQRPTKLKERFCYAMLVMNCISKKDSNRCNLTLAQSLVRKFDFLFTEKPSQPKKTFYKIVMDFGEDNGKSDRISAFAAKSALDLNI